MDSELTLLVGSAMVVAWLGGVLTWMVVGRIARRGLGENERERER